MPALSIILESTEAKEDHQSLHGLRELPSKDDAFLLRDLKVGRPLHLLGPQSMAISYPPAQELYELVVRGMVSLCEGLPALEARPRHLLQLPLLDVLHKFRTPKCSKV